MPTKSAEEQREFIKYQLRLRGSSFADVSRELGVTPATVSQVCSGKRTSERVLSAIAHKLGLERDRLLHCGPTEGVSMR